MCLAGWVCTLPPVDRMTDACENITFPQLLLRMVKIGQSELFCRFQRKHYEYPIDFGYLSHLATAKQ